MGYIEWQYYYNNGKKYAWKNYAWTNVCTGETAEEEYRKERGIEDAKESLSEIKKLKKDLAWVVAKIKEEEVEKAEAATLEAARELAWNIEEATIEMDRSNKNDCGGDARFDYSTEERQEAFTKMILNFLEKR